MFIPTLGIASTTLNKYVNKVIGYGRTVVCGDIYHHGILAKVFCKVCRNKIETILFIFKKTRMSSSPGK